MKHKWLYDFNVYDEFEDTVEEKKKDDNGEDITISRKVTKKRAVEFSILKPDRKLFESAELFYAVKLSEGIKAGLLTRPLLAKRYKNDGGAMSEPEKKRYAELYYDMLIKQEQMERLKLNLQDEGKDERHRIAGALMADIVQLREELTEYEMAQTTLFDQTAENRAKNQTIMWWVLHLAHRNDKPGRVPLFDGENHEAKLNQYDELEESDDPFLVEVIKKFAYYVTFWYLNGITDKKDFEQVRTMYNRDNDVDEDALEKEIEKQNKPKEEPKAEEPKAEEPKAEEPKAEEPKAEEPKAEEPKKEEPKAEEPKKEEPKAEEPKKEEPKAKEPKKKKPKKSKQEQKEAQVQAQEIENAT